eukprot:COSAG02_NODE_45656_length_355_cov_0.792969_1_plen_40_part_10
MGKVTKLPASAPVIDESKVVTAALSMKPGYGTLRSATVAT